MKSLRQGSKPEYFRPRTTYAGPPIGCGAKVVQHTSLEGSINFTIHGNTIAPRPAYVVKCNDAECVKCGGVSASPASARASSSKGSTAEGSEPTCAAKVVHTKVDENAEKDSVAA